LEKLQIVRFKQKQVSTLTLRERTLEGAKKKYNTSKEERQIKLEVLSGLQGTKAKPEPGNPHRGRIGQRCLFYHGPKKKMRMDYVPRQEDKKGTCKRQAEISFPCQRMRTGKKAMLGAIRSEGWRKRGALKISLNNVG